jgi:hypothetical protein
MSNFKVLLPGEDQTKLLNEFIMQEMELCKDSEPELMELYGDPQKFPIDFFHPPQKNIIGMSYRVKPDGQKFTVIICQPVPEHDSAIMQWVDTPYSVWFCPHAVLISKPTEEADLAI